MSMITVLQKLFAKHSPANHETDAPALQCQVGLKSGYQMQGLLSHTGTLDPDLRYGPHGECLHKSNSETANWRLENYADRRSIERGILRMAVVAMQPDPQFPRNEQLAKKIIAEHFFDYGDIEFVILMHPVGDQADGKKIVLAST